MTDKEIDYNLLEVEKGNKRYGIYLKNHIEDLTKERNKLYKQLQQKENIIKDVREKIHDIWFKIDFTNMTSMSYVTIKLDETSQGNELLEILDREDM